MQRDERENNFDFIRLFAAYLVLVSHSWGLFAGGPEFMMVASGYVSGGRLAVATFFFVSGYLVLGSLERRPELLNFAAARALRLLPGLFVSVTFCIFVVGASFTVLPLRDYFSSSVTWSYYQNVLIFYTHFFLPGVFEALPAKGVNGSLWTLPVEVTMYLFLFVAFRLGMMKGMRALVAPVIFFCALTIGQTVWHIGWSNLGGFFFHSVAVFTFLLYGLFFTIGSAFYVFRDVIRPNGALALAALCIFVGTFHSPYGFMGEVIGLPYLIYYVAHCPLPLWRLTRRTGDLSYGVYIYAFPIQQTIYATCSSFLGFWEMMALAAVATGCMAWMSWHFVEEPTLKWKRFFNRESYVAIRMARIREALWQKTFGRRVSALGTPLDEARLAGRAGE